MSADPAYARFATAGGRCFPCPTPKSACRTPVKSMRRPARDTAVPPPPARPGSGACVDPTALEMREDAPHHRELGDERDDPHRTTTGRAHLDLDLVDAPQQFRPAPAARTQGGPVRRGLGRTRGRRRCARQHDAATLPPHAVADGASTVVAHARLVALGHVLQPAGDDLERAHAVHAGVRSLASP